MLRLSVPYRFSTLDAVPIECGEQPTHSFTSIMFAKTFGANVLFSLSNRSSATFLSKKQKVFNRLVQYVCGSFEGPLHSKVHLFVFEAVFVFLVRWINIIDPLLRLGLGHS